VKRGQKLSSEKNVDHILALLISRSYDATE